MKHSAKSTVGLKVLVFLLIFCSLTMLDVSGQDYAYKGHNFQLEAKTNHRLSPQIYFKYAVSRKQTIGLSLGIRKQEVSARRIIVDEDLYNGYDDERFNMPLNSSYIEFNYNKYSGIAHLKRYFCMGFGVEMLSWNTNDLDFDLYRESSVENEKATVPYINVGLGSNWFITDNFYISSEITANFSFMSGTDSFFSIRTASQSLSRAEQDSIYLNGNMDSNKGDFYINKLLRPNLGIGFSF